MKNFIDDANKIHNNKYDYSKVKYVNAKTKVTIICPEHGEFKQILYSHLKGFGCKKCAAIERGNKRLISTKDFIADCIKIHGDKFDYSKVNYTGNKNKVKIICPKHGEFEQMAIEHKTGTSCPECFNDKRKKKNLKFNLEDFINKINEIIPKNNYDYSKSVYINGHTPINIVCPKHGEIIKTPNNIYRWGKVCKKCNPKKIQPNALTTKDFITRANKIHKNKYNYTNVKYINAKKKVNIICPEHGEFKQIAYNHINKNNSQGCPDCALKYEKTENEVKDFIKSLNLNFLMNNRKLLGNNQEIDIYIPSKKIGIEFNGLYWHSDLKINNDYHLNKTNLALNNNISLIHIFEDEWLFKRDIVKSRLKNILGLSEKRIYARKCEIKKVKTKEAKEFSNLNHLQGYTNSNVKLGLYYDSELVSLMLFSKPRLGIGKKFDGYELTRFCNKLDTTVIGGASRLLKNFISEYQPKNIKSYADRRWGNGGLYRKLGFRLDAVNKPNYWYVKSLKRFHRFGFRKDKLNDMGYDIENKTEKEITESMGLYRIYDCGTLSFIL